jgi:O-antigen/teichoic acid export membrane protein
MIAEAQTTVRNAGLILVQRGIHAASGLVFALLVPRLMGPDIYGRFSLLTSLSIWFLLFSSLSLTDVIGRYVPEFLLRHDESGLRGFWGDLLTVRLATAVLAAGAYLALTVVWLRDLDVSLLVLMAGMVFVRAIGELVFAAFLGYNQASRWQVGETVRQWLSLGLLLPGFYLGGLRGGMLSLLLTEFVVLALGVWGIRSYLTWPGLHLDVRGSTAYLRFGLVVFASDVLNTAVGASGETLVRAITGDYVQVGYFGLAWRVFTTMAMAIPQLAMAFVPLLATWRAQGQTRVLTQWTERLLKYLAFGGVLAASGMVFLADDLVPVVLGAEYQPVAGNLVWLSLTLVPLAVGHIARLVATVYVQPRVAVAASAVRLLAFWLLGVPLVGRLGSLGSSIAMLGASLLYAAYFAQRMGRVLPYSLRKTALAVVIGALFLPLAWLKSSWQVNVCLYGIFMVGYCGLLLLGRIVSRGEVVELWQAVTSKGGALKGAAGEQ